MFFIASCGQNDNKQNELNLKEKELAFKQKELELKETELKHDSVNLQQNKSVTNALTAIGTYIVNQNKSHFFNSPNLTTIRKGYVVKGDIVEIQKIEGDFGYCNFMAPSGQQVSGWLLTADLQFISGLGDNNNNSIVNSKKFVGVWKTNSGKEKEIYNISYEGGEFYISVEWSKSYAAEMEQEGHMNILGNCSDYIGKSHAGIIKAKHTEMSSCDNEILISLINDNQISVSNQYEKGIVVYYRK